MNAADLQEAIGTVRQSGLFEEPWYRARYCDVGLVGLDPIEHYLRIGYRLMRDPGPEFSTQYYLTTNGDVARSGMNPLLHYIRFGEREGRIPRRPLRARTNIGPDYQPRVSVIVPNYNHARFLPERLDSILGQTYRNIDLLVLDDCSTDDSRDVISAYCQRHPDRVRGLFNSTNSGNVFRQWRKGVENTDGELIWICESDDTCEPDFLEQLVETFHSRSVNLAFGRIQFSDSEGAFKPGLDQYREGAEPGIWSAPVVRPAAEWFARGFGVNNLIANVGGSVWRRQSLPAEVWDEAQTYSVLGDWFLYAQLAGGGRIAYEPGAIAYFRQHGDNTSVNAFRSPGYYSEHFRLMTSLKKCWTIPNETLESFHGKIDHQYRHFEVARTHGDLSRYFDKDALMQVPRVRPHILIALLGFLPGGGELLPIFLANALQEAGFQVSVLEFDPKRSNADMEKKLAAGIPVYTSDFVNEIGVNAFIERTGITLIHSHMVSLDYWFFWQHDFLPKIPYVVTLHGSYEACEVDLKTMSRFNERVSHWVYTADKNLEPLKSFNIPAEKCTKLANGMPDDPRPFPQTRAELGIAEDEVVFTFVARGIKRKGWRVLIDAFRQLRASHPDTVTHLLLCGDGPETELHRERIGPDSHITFLGYQSCINGLYRISDCAVIPTRYMGESAPLCVIQAMQEGIPVIATRTGEIPNMISDGHETAGLMLDLDRDTPRFTEHLMQSMAKMLSSTTRESFGKASRRLGKRFGIDNLTREHSELYAMLLAQSEIQARGSAIE